MWHSSGIEVYLSTCTAIKSCIWVTTYRHSPRAAHAFQSFFFSPSDSPWRRPLLVPTGSLGKKEVSCFPFEPLLIITTGLIRNTDLQSLQDRKREIREWSLYLAGCEEKTNSCKVRTNMLLLDEEVTLPFDKPEIKPFSSPKHRWDQQGRNQRLLAICCTKKTGRKLWGTVPPGWQWAWQSVSTKLGRGKRKPL